MTDKPRAYDLERFVAAQAGSYATAVAELKRGRKRNHWMWYIFPQIAGLGSSPTAQFHAIRSIDEVRAYLNHPVLGAHLRASIEVLQDLTGTTAEAVFGNIDAMKLRSCLTLFIAAGGEPIFNAALQRWFGGRADDATLKRLAP